MGSTLEPASMNDDETPQRDSQFVFVTDHDRGYIRSYLRLQTSSTKRNERNSRKIFKKRMILPATSYGTTEEEVASSSSTKRQSRAEEQPSFDYQIPGNPAAFASLPTRTSLRTSSIENCENILDLQGLGNDHYDETSGEAAELLELETNQDTTANYTSHNKPYEYNKRYSQSPKSSSIISSWEVANFDPFQTSPATVRPFEQALIHHWINIFGTMMFGKPRSSINPMAEVWIPEALSNEASFQGMLSYAAAHLAHLRGRDSGIRGVIYKTKAIAYTQKLLNNEATMLSDSTVGAVLRQISIEDRFGSPELASLHRAGLEKIIEKRGGKIRGNWRLELLFHWYLITSKPTFHFRRQTDQEVSSDLMGNDGLKGAITPRHPNQLSGLSSKLFDFLNELRCLTISTASEVRGQGIRLCYVENETGPANRLLYLFANAPGPSRGPTHDIVEETCRLAALFYMAITKADSLRSGTNDFEELNNTLRETQLAWEYSLEMLLWVLLRGKGPGVENPEKVQLVLSFMEAAKLLRKESWNVVKKMLIGFLCNDPQKAVGISDESMLFVADLIGMQY